MKRAARILLLLAALGALFWWCPLVHLVPLRQAETGRRLAAFNAVEYAGTFWTNRLVPSLNRAIDAATVVRALAEDAPAARARYGRAIGLGSAAFFFLRGTGTVVSV